MNMHTIRFRYTALFCSLGICLTILVLMNNSLVSTTEDSLVRFGSNFNPAISAVINADRDLYQAKVAELKVLNEGISSGNIEQNYADYQENAKQALDRFNKYKQLMSDYPDVNIQLKGFDASYNLWLTESNQVFSLVKNNQLSAAKAHANTTSQKTFDELREFYNLAGELADKKSTSVSKETISTVDSSIVILSVISGIIIILTFVIGIAAPKAMADALHDLSEKLKAINTGDGDLTKRICSKRKDEIGQVANNLDEFIDSLANLIKSIVDQSSQVISGVSELDAGATEIKETSEQQLLSVEMIVTAVNEMSYAIAEVAKNAQLTSTEIMMVNNLAHEGTDITSEAVSEIQGLSVTVEEATAVIVKLSENSQNIASVLDVIRGIAEQTNLLALNAAIEAARAGEQGRGFAVVADEVRTLASRTQQSTEDIQVMIEALKTGVDNAVTAIGKGNAATKTSVELSQKTLEALEKISEASNRVSDVAAQTATATEEQSQVSDDVSKNLTVMSDQTKVNHEVAGKNSYASETTMQLATALSNSVTRFKLE
ncbi:methyl-accepting chemotaxis protein [Thalassotalea castellviae]|uniref:Methyl-accepting chemotaxis protein n=1 Tax=Thalassotalea castellviae TaxID=3075612 RepID=A0ABU3A2C0_9GAMM|nr:methyl-accepting chemotaxis protein [Thalassotalea sp. W431]MDT0603692.1 methyl-accepting chemotaxis protein [Thalassotalea sp. W431]